MVCWVIDIWVALHKLNEFWIVHVTEIMPKYLENIPAATTKLLPPTIICTIRTASEKATCPLPLCYKKRSDKHISTNQRSYITTSALLLMLRTRTLRLRRVRKHLKSWICCCCFSSRGIEQCGEASSLRHVWTLRQQLRPISQQLGPRLYLSLWRRLPQLFPVRVPGRQCFPFRPCRTSPPTTPQTQPTTTELLHLQRLLWRGELNSFQLDRAR